MISTLRLASSLTCLLLAAGCAAQPPAPKRNLTLVQKTRPLGPPSYYYRAGDPKPNPGEQAIAHTRQ